MLQEKVKSPGRVIQKNLDQYLKMLKKAYENIYEDIATDIQNNIPVSNNLVFRELMFLFISSGNMDT